jgi:endonuclease/exonuclease/phosphatase family metal-dependent hydrolase
MHENSTRDTLRVATLNIRFQSHDDLMPGDGRLHPWKERRRDVLESVRAMDADIVGFQEAQTEQYRFLADELPGYGTHISGPVGETLDQTFLIMWKRHLFAKVDAGSAPIQAEWPHNRRAIAWARLRLRDTGNELFTFNTHFPPGREEEEKVALCRFTADLINETAGGEGPVLLTGDLNIHADDSEGIRILSDAAGLHHPWADTGASLQFTWKGWGQEPRARENIDWILYRRPLEAVSVERPGLTEQTPAPSDHLPVCATLEWPRQV